MNEPYIMSSMQQMLDFQSMKLAALKLAIEAEPNKPPTKVGVRKSKRMARRGY